MTRKDAVVQTLTDGFGAEAVEVEQRGDNVVLKVFRHGEFLIDADGNVTPPADINPDLAYYIGLDLQSLDLLRGGDA